MGKHSGWKWADALEMRKAYKGMWISLAPKYSGRGEWDTLRWEVILLDEAENDVARFNFSIDDHSKSNRQRWLIARAHINMMIINDELDNKFSPAPPPAGDVIPMPIIDSHAVPEVMSGEYDGKIVADIWED